MKFDFGSDCCGKVWNDRADLLCSKCNPVFSEYVKAYKKKLEAMERQNRINEILSDIPPGGTKIMREGAGYDTPRGGAIITRGGTKNSIDRVYLKMNPGTEVTLEYEDEYDNIRWTYKFKDADDLNCLLEDMAEDDVDLRIYNIDFTKEFLDDSTETETIESEPEQEQAKEQDQEPEQEQGRVYIHHTPENHFAFLMEHNTFDPNSSVHIMHLLSHFPHKIDERGMISIRIPRHPAAKDGYYPLHRFVMELHLLKKNIVKNLKYDPETELYYLPKSTPVIFLDGDFNNCAVSNLALIPETYRVDDSVFKWLSNFLHKEYPANN